ncbi:MAG TPA: hypothetical protein VIE66_02590 [Methylocella sp.]
MPATAFAKLIMDTAPATLEGLAKAQIAGKDTGLEKCDYIGAIQKRGDLLFPAIASPQARFAKAMIEDDTGRLLYAAMKSAPGADVAPPPVEVAKASPSIDATEHASLIEKYRHAHPEKSYAQCYAATLQSNPALAKRVLDASRERCCAG